MDPIERRSILIYNRWVIFLCLGLTGLPLISGGVAARPTKPKHDRLGYQYLSPLPKAELISKDSRIILGPGVILDSQCVSDSSWIKVTGSISGIHRGKLYLASDSMTVVFSPHNSYIPGEMVTVHVGKGLRTKQGEAIAPIEYTFTVSPKTVPILKPEEVWYLNFFKGNRIETKERISDKTRSGKVSLSTDFPPLAITKKRNPTPGYLFIAPFIFPESHQDMAFMIIMNNDGEVVYYKRDFHPLGDFQVLGNRNLAYYWYATKTQYIMDMTFTVVDSFTTIGYETDGHDFRYFDNGRVFVMAYDRQRVNMSQVVPGGKINAIVEGFIIQELDHNREVVFEWRSWDHFQITDATDSVNLADTFVDYVHGNSIDVDTDGNLLISSRNMDECTKISRESGDIIWRLGGRLCENNEFSFINDEFEGFTFQHDFRRVGDHYLVFDNANNHVPSVPRALEYAIDEEAMTATLVWEYRFLDQVDDSHMGSIQRLTNGNTLINWGGSFWGDNDIRITEIDPRKNVTFEMTFGKNRYKTYRVCRSDWQGQAKVPYLVAEINSKDKMVILTYNVFGSANFNGYNIYHGYRPHPAEIMASTTENQIELTNLEYGNHYFRVTALDSEYYETGFSNEEKVRITWSNIQIPEIPKPREFILSQNYPNPFGSTTAISYGLPQAEAVKISVIDVEGNLVDVILEEHQPAGYYKVMWDASDAKSGIYFYRLETTRYRNVKKMVVLHKSP